jgi:hypothetical protein
VPALALTSAPVTFAARAVSLASSSAAALSNSGLGSTTIELATRDRANRADRIGHNLRLLIEPGRGIYNESAGFQSVIAHADLHLLCKQVAAKHRLRRAGDRWRWHHR